MSKQIIVVPARKIATKPDLTEKEKSQIEGPEGKEEQTMTEDESGHRKRERRPDVQRF